MSLQELMLKNKLRKWILKPKLRQLLANRNFGHKKNQTMRKEKTLKSSIAWTKDPKSSSMETLTPQQPAKSKQNRVKKETKSQKLRQIS